MEKHINPFYGELVDYLGGQSRTATLLGVKQCTVSGWVRGYHGMSPTVALWAEKVTDGKFRAIDLNDKLAKLHSG